jgi:hypothetical protein
VVSTQSTTRYKDGIFFFFFFFWCASATISKAREINGGRRAISIGAHGSARAQGQKGRIERKKNGRRKRGGPAKQATRTRA